jgi:hypothetical protein
MKQCPTCNFENIRNRFYCEQCGTLLPSSTSQQVKTSTPRSQEYTQPLSQRATPLPPPISIPHFISSEEPVAPAPSRTQEMLSTLARIALYMTGSGIAAFGLYVLLTPFTHSAFIGLLSLFPGSIVLLMLAFLLHRAPALNWRQRLLRILTTTGGTLVILLLGSILVGIQPPATIDKVANIVYGSCILAYGCFVAIIALW